MLKNMLVIFSYLLISEARADNRIEHATHIDYVEQNVVIYRNYQLFPVQWDVRLDQLIACDFINGFHEPVDWKYTSLIQSIEYGNSTYPTLIITTSSNLIFVKMTYSSITTHDVFTELVSKIYEYKYRTLFFYKPPKKRGTPHNEDVEA